MKQSSSPERLLQLTWAYAPTLIIASAVNHRVFDLLHAGPQTVRQLAQKSGASERGLTRFSMRSSAFNFFLVAASDTR